jgi:hypothetical protein
MPSGLVVALAKTKDPMISCLTLQKDVLTIMYLQSMALQWRIM